MLLLRTNMIWTRSEQINDLEAAILWVGGRDPAGMRDNWGKDLPSEGIKAKVNGKCYVFCRLAVETRSTI